mgnify:CR=1 FL=1
MEKSLFEKIENEVAKLGITKEEMDMLYANTDSKINKIFSLENECQKRLALNELSSNVIKNKLGIIFNKASLNDLTPEQKQDGAVLEEFKLFGITLGKTEVIS